MSNVYEKQTELNTKNVVVSVAENHMRASIVLDEIGQDGAYTYEEVIDKLSAAGVRTGIDEAKIRDVIVKKIYGQEVVVAQGKRQSMVLMDTTFSTSMRTMREITSQP